MLVVLRWGWLLYVMTIMRANSVVMITTSASKPDVLVRMTKSADNRVESLQGDGEEGDEDLATAAQSNWPQRIATDYGSCQPRRQCN